MKKLEKKDKIELIITVVLVIVFIVLTDLFLKRNALRPAAAARASKEIFLVPPDFKHDPRRGQGMAFLWEKSAGDQEVKRDPFLHDSTDNDLSLKGIIWNSDRPSAVINERVVAIGDVIGNLKVTQITQDSVVLENEHSKLELKLSR